MSDYTQDLIRLANAANEASDWIVDDDGSVSESLWQTLEGLPQEIRMSLNSPIFTTEEWHEFLRQPGSPALDDFADPADVIYHVEPS